MIQIRGEAVICMGLSGDARLQKSEKMDLHAINNC
jgi:hypothetical protein